MFTPRSCVCDFDCDCDCDCDCKDNKIFKFKLNVLREFKFYESIDIDNKVYGMFIPHACVYDYDLDCYCDCEDNI